MKKIGVYILTILTLASLCIASAQTTQISIEPSVTEVSQGDTFSVNITIVPGNETMGAQYTLCYDNILLKPLAQNQGSFLGQDGNSPNLFKDSINYGLGEIKYGEARSGTEVGVNTSGILSTIEFKARSPGIGDLTLKEVKLSNPNATYITDLIINNGTVNNAQSQPPTSFIVCGYVFYQNSSDCNNPEVSITNLNISKEWTAETTESSNNYQIMLSSTPDIVADEILQFNATSPDGSQSISAEYTVTQADIDTGVLEYNITLGTSIADTTPPVIINVANSTPTGSAVTITWDTDEASTSMVKYGNATGTYTDNVSDAAMVSAHSIALSGLSPDTTYYFVVSSTDASSNSNESEELSFTTTSTAADTTPPTVTDHSPTGSDIQVDTIISATFDEAMNQSSAEAAFSINPVVNGTITWSANTMSFDPELDLEETTYTVTINTEAKDVAGNTLEAPFTWDFTTGTTVPSTTTVSIGEISIEPGESTIVPIMVGNVENLSGCRINLTYDTSVVHVTGITQGDMNLLAYNINNGTGWMTANALDESGLDGDVTFVNIEFTALGGKGNSTILDMTVLELFADGFTSIEHTVEDGSFTIEADNEGPVVTDAIGDRDEILNDNGRPRAPGTNTTTLSVTVTDADSGVANVVIDLSSIGGSVDQPMDKIGETDVWTVTTNATDGINLTHQLTITATDNEGNINSSVNITLTVLRRGDVYRDNVIDNKDVLYIARYLANLEPEYSNPPTVLVGDIVGMSGVPQGDGTVDLMDALYIAKYLANLEGEP